MSESPRCIAPLQTHAKNMHVPEGEFFLARGRDTGPDRFWATSQRLLRSGATPSRGSMAMAPAMNTVNIHGEQTSANWLSFSKPRMANIVIASRCRQ